MLLNHGYRFSDDPDDPKKRPISDFLLYLPEHRWYQTNIGVCLSLIERMEEVPYTAEQIRQLKFLTPGDATSRIRQALSQQLDELQADNDASKQQICVP